MVRRRQPEAAPDDLYTQTIQAITRLMEAFGESHPCAVDPEHGTGQWMVVSPQAEVVDVCSLACLERWAQTRAAR